MSEDKVMYVVEWFFGDDPISDGHAAAHDLAAAEKEASVHSRSPGAQAFVELGDKRVQEWRGGFRYDGSVAQALNSAASVFGHRADLLALARTEPIAAAALGLREIEQTLRDYAIALFPTVVSKGELVHMFEALSLLVAETPEAQRRVIACGQIAATLAALGGIGTSFGEDVGKVTYALIHGFRAALNDEALDPKTRDRYAAHLDVVSHDIFRGFAK